ncbi:unnamed protein product [Rotaria magnacalcarata]|uniref:Uncharacterized protein n=1 Tax=Rotaria magnacalcarata TaxID=392030 RepID=A0A819Y616_9BILA|nr:unnamed protein product [Rotaria magnacalcarata]
MPWLYNIFETLSEKSVEVYRPGSYWWLKIHSRTSCPLNAVWLSCLIAFIFALPCLANTTTHMAIISLSTVCLYISYGLPILCKILYPHTFLRGPFHLGSFSRFINIVSLIWINFIIVLFALPTIYPISSITMNYTSIGVLSILICSGFAYFCSAKYWFEGPVTNLIFNYNKDKLDFIVKNF